MVTRTCIDCGGGLRAAAQGERCKPCRRARTCIDCGATLAFYTKGTRCLPCYHAAMPTPKRRDNYSASERGVYGVTATLVSAETGQTVVRAWTGMTTQQAVREAAALCDEMGNEWKIRTLSHPLSILNDLDHYGDTRTQQIEAKLLSRIGRADLVERARQDAGLRTAAIRARRRRL